VKRENTTKFIICTEIYLPGSDGATWVQKGAIAPLIFFFKMFIILGYYYNNLGRVRYMESGKLLFHYILI
jgi:hypothetical protein